MQRLSARTPGIGLRALSVCALLISLSACERSTPPAGSAAAPASAPPAAAAPAQAKLPASTLQALLSVFSGQTAPAWSAFDAVPGLHWSDPKPLENPDAIPPNETHYRGGDMTLSGFNEVDVPDGKVGADAGVKKDNEGHVGFVLNGDVDHVQSIVLDKFYPSDDTLSILQRQFSSDTTVKPIASECTLDAVTGAENTQKNAFFEIGLPNAAAPLYAETYVEEDAQGPGRTIFVFYWTKPIKQIKTMRCKTV